MPVRPLARALSLGLLVLAASCGSGLDLTTALAVTDVQSGYYNNGLKDGQHHLLPNVSFRLQNASDVDLTSVQITVQFWQDGADGELDSRALTGISTEALTPGAKTDPIVVRSEAGYLLPDPDITTLFQNSQFSDVMVRVFARRSGHIVKIFEQNIERRILSQAPSPERP